MLEALIEPGRALALAGPFRAAAESALAGAPLDGATLRATMACPDHDLAALLWAAYAVRAQHFGRRVKLCVLNNARSGLCPEDCGYCSQSAVSDAEIPAIGSSRSPSWWRARGKRRRAARSGIAW